MVRQAYINRVFLGRSAFEPPDWAERERSRAQHAQLDGSSNPVPNSSSTESYVQQYNIRGHAENPVSRQAARRLRRAQNDVLSTIGVCVSIDENGEIKSNLNPANPRARAEKKITQATASENESGYHATTYDEILYKLATGWTYNLRRRLMTFNYYQGIPMASIIAIELRHLGAFAFSLAGEIPTNLANIANVVAAFGVDGIEMFLLDFFEDQHETAISLFCRILHVLPLCTLLAPLQFLASLQRLGLVASWPPLPTLTGSFQKSLFLPPKPLKWTKTSAIAYAGSLALSPLVTWIFHQFIYEFLEVKLTKYLQSAILRPDNPDSESYKIRTDSDGSAIDSPVLSLPPYRTSLVDVISKDLENVAEEVNNARVSLEKFFRKGVRSVKRLFLLGSEESSFQTVTFAQETTAADLDESVLSSPFEALVEEGQEAREGQGQSGMVASIPSYSAPPSSMDSDSPESDDEPATVQVRTRSGSTSTLHMDLEVNVPLQNRNAAVPLFGTGATPHGHENGKSPVLSDTKPYHRVTALTTHASSTLSIHIARMLASAICIPIESYYLRSLARSYIEARGPESRWLSHTVYSPSAWSPGLLGWGFAGSYPLRLLMCFGLEVVFGFVQWRAWCLWPVYAGKKWYSWGKL